MRYKGHRGKRNGKTTQGYYKDDDDTFCNPDGDTYSIHREQRIALSRRLKRCDPWCFLATIIEPLFQAQSETSFLTLPHSSTTAANEVGIRIPDVSCRDCAGTCEPPSFTALLITR